METLAGLAHGFDVALTPLNFGLAMFGAFAGTLVGALPGLGPANGVAILVPLAFTLGLPPESALILLAAVYYGAMYGGRISSIMLNIPGDEPAVMTLLEGNPMARQGKAGAALALSAVSSFVGATLATIGLTFLAPLLVELAILFGPAEYFILFLLAFSMIGTLTGKNVSKTFIASALGLMLATIGLDPATNVPRYTFGQMKLFDGLDPIIAIVGLFAISEVLVFLETVVLGEQVKFKVERTYATFKELWFCAGAMLRGSVLGFICGVLPGAGASLGSFAAYTMEKRYSDRGTFGKGDPRGLAAPEAGNNAAAGGALVPMLALGVPGSGTTAVLLALLISLNITPGPLLFVERPEVAWGLIASLYMANVVLLILNLPLVNIFVRLLMVPTYVLMPTVTLICFLGIYAISHSVFDIYMMIGVGVFGYLLRKVNIPLVPVILGVLLGHHMEVNLRRALSLSDGEWEIMFRSPLAITLWAFIIMSLTVPFIIRAIRERRGEQ
ncbi:MAG: tripartite tricarboxylate transporter permease [Rhodospirillales bacterium]|nr:tripartite tricarboxylate transporter permease [Rhodospirillales bacterium]